MWVLPWGRVALSSPPPQSKDLEQQLQEELLEVVSELQMVRACDYREAVTSPLPGPGSGRRIRCLGETWVSGIVSRALSPCPGC